jgi:aerobic carbon-monoxide dehydrogenase medium subunit
VKPAPFAYKKARSLDEALGLIASEPEAKLLAGGQSLIAALNMRLSAPPLLVDINGIDGLDRIEARNGTISIGALVRHAQAERSDVIAKHAPLVARSLPHIAHPAVRNRGTIGGSIAYADPAAELPACLVALGGEVIARGANGERAIAADDFFRGLFETALAPGEIVTAIRLAASNTDTRTGFAELTRRHGDYALVGLAATARANGKALRDVRLAFFGVGATPLRQPRAERALAEGDVDGAIAALALHPSDDVQATGAVRKHLAGVLLRRVAAQLMEAQR